MTKSFTQPLEHRLSSVNANNYGYCQEKKIHINEDAVLGWEEKGPKGKSICDIPRGEMISETLINHRKEIRMFKPIPPTTDS